MNLSSVGLKLEASIYHEETETMAFVSTNEYMQVDGEGMKIYFIQWLLQFSFDCYFRLKLSVANALL